MTINNSSTAASQTVETVEFSCEEWLVTRTPEGEIVSIRPIAGTWTLVSGEDQRRFGEKGIDVKAMFACPRCNNIGFIGSNFNPPKEHGDTKPLPELHCCKCQFGCRSVLKNWDKRRLYCICYETIVGTKVTTHKDYLHAEDEFEARKFFWAQHPEVMNNQSVIHVAGIAPAIGFFVPNPKDDRILVV